MKLLNIISLVLPFVGAISFFCFFILNDRQDDKRNPKPFLYAAILCAALLIIIFVARLIVSIFG